MTTLARFSDGIVLQAEPEDHQPAIGAQRGRVVRIDSDGRLFVDFPGNLTGPVHAKLAVSAMELAEVVESAEPTEILLVFENNDPALPIIVGTVRDRLPSDGIEIYIRGRRITVDAGAEIELRCGDGKVRITRDGKVVVLGNDVVSRARRQNRIKGGTVNIN